MKNSIYERKEDFGKAEKPEDFLSAPFLHIPGDIPVDYIDMDKFYKSIVYRDDDIENDMDEDPNAILIKK